MHSFISSFSLDSFLIIFPLFFQAQEFFFFAILLGVVTVIFAIMAWFYTYVYYGSERSVESLNDGESAPLLDDEEEDEEQEKEQGDDKESKM